MPKIVITAETGCDIPAAEAAELGVTLVPMHVTIGDKTIDDGELSSAEMLERCRQLGVLPKTSGCSPHDFQVVFDRIHEEDPEAQILHVAYSAVTTCSLASAEAAAEGRDYVATLDTRHVTIGQGLVVRELVAWLREHPEASVEEARDFAIQELTRMRVINGPQDVIDSHRERVKKAYPAYFDTYSRMDELVEYLDSFGNLYCVGRNGQHRYNNMDHSMATAMEAVGNIKTGKTSKKNVWSVNTEQSYHESK